MKIHKLLYRKTSDSPTAEYSFSEHMGGFERTWVLHVNLSEIEFAQSAIKECLLDIDSQKNYYSRVELFDGDGGEWVVEFLDGIRIVSKNGSKIENSQPLKQLYKKLKDDLNPDSVKEVKNLINEHFMSTTEGKIVTFETKNKSQANQHFMGMLKKRKRFLSSDIFENFKDLKTLNANDQVEVVKKLSNLYNQYNFTLAERNKFSEEISEKLYSATEMSTDYKKQLNIIAEVESLYQELSQPNSSVACKKEKMAFIQEEIQELLESMELSGMPCMEKVPNWSEMFSVLCRYNILEKLVKFTEKSSKIAHEDVEPLVDNFIKSLDNMVSQQEIYAGEVESCIASINVKLASQNIEFSLDKSELTRSQSQDEKIEMVMSWFDKLKSKITNENNEEEQIKEDQSDLEVLRASLEFLLEKFVEIRVSLSQIRNYNKDSYLQELEDNYQKQLKAFGKVKQEWSVIAEEMHFSEKMTIKQLMLVAFNYMRLVELGESKKLIEDSIKIRKEKIDKLTFLIESWRKAINSQKMTDLENSSILMSEARSIIRYKSERTRKAELQEAIENEAHDDKRLLKILNERVEALKQSWMSVCEDFGIDDMTIDHADMDKIIEYKTRIMELHDFARDNRPEALENTMDLCQDGLLNIWVWEEINTENRARINFLNTIEKNGLGNGVNLFFIADQTITDFFTKLGAGQVKANRIKAKSSEVVSLDISEPSTIAKKQTPSGKTKDGHVVQSQTLQRRIIKSSHQPAPQVPSRASSVMVDLTKNENQDNSQISPRAKAVLDLLNSKPGRR